MASAVQDAPSAVDAIESVRWRILSPHVHPGARGYDDIDVNLSSDYDIDFPTPVDWRECHRSLNGQADGLQGFARSTAPAVSV